MLFRSIMNMKTDRMIIRDFTMNDINDMQDILGDKVFAETIDGMDEEMKLFLPNSGSCGTI